MLHHPQSDKTKPNELTPRQLAAARAVARGGAAAVVARELKVTRQTLHRWKRSPQFQAELKRLHELLAAQPTATPAPPDTPRVPSRPAPRSTHAIDRKFDRMLDEFLGRGIPAEVRDRNAQRSS